MAEAVLDQLPYSTEDLVLGANGVKRLTGLVSAVAILSATDTAGVAISFDGGTFFPLPIGVSPSWGKLRQLWVKDISGATNTIRVAKGTAELYDRRLLIDALNPLAFSLTGDARCIGSEAHDAPITKAPVIIGAEARDSERAAVSAAGDVVKLAADLVGRQIVIPYANPENTIEAEANPIAAADVALFAAQGAGVRSYITDLVITEMGGAAATVELRDNATIRRRFKVAANGCLPMSFPVPLRGSANVAWNVRLGGAGDVRVAAAGFKGR